jgi:hypothetical protein
MASGSLQSTLGEDEFAFHFQSDAGVDAKDLGIFLQRAATVAGGAGAQIRIVGIQDGSLDVIVRTLGKIKVPQNVRDEFQATPIKTTAASIALTATVVALISHAMSPAGSAPTPLAKAGADIVEHRNVNQIQIITINKNVVIMDHDRVRQIRAMEQRGARRELLPSTEVRSLVDKAQNARLTGAVVDVEGELHFRPDGYKYLVPLQSNLLRASEELYAGGHFQIGGELFTRNRQPELLVVRTATEV